MSTLREHIDALLALRNADGTRKDERMFELQSWLIATSHLDEVSALLDQVSKPPPCSAQLIAGAWQCDHCGYFSLEAPGCAHTAALGIECDITHEEVMRLAGAFERSADWLDFAKLDGPPRTHPLVGTADYRMVCAILRAAAHLWADKGGETK